MAGFGIPFLDNSVYHAPLTPAPGPTVQADQTWRSSVTFLPSHGAAYQTQTADVALTYIGSNLIYVFVFILLTLVLTWTVGKKGTMAFLVLVLLGQLIFNVDAVKALFPAPKG